MRSTAEEVHSISEAEILRQCLKSLCGYHKAAGEVCAPCVHERETERDEESEITHAGRQSVFHRFIIGWMVCSGSVCLGSGSVLYYFLTN